jgi:fructose-1,6-bisphosphatase/inositol monophosphatase family enzyme
VVLPDIDKVTQLILETATVEIMPRFQRLAEADIREKSPGELVTVADEAAEAWLAPRLTALIPGCLVLGEEEAAREPALIDRLSNDGTTWVIDPIDGTANFAAGRPGFAVMVALVRNGELLAAWIHVPTDAITAVAAAGQGAWIGERRLKVAGPPADVAELAGTLHAGSFGRPELGRKIQSRRERVRALKSLRCAGLEYIRLAAGDMHFALFTKLMPWDHAPGVLIHREAGGYAGYLEGGSFHPAEISHSGLLLAPNRDSWQSLHEVLLGDS